MISTKIYIVNIGSVFLVKRTQKKAEVMKIRQRKGPSQENQISPAFSLVQNYSDKIQMVNIGSVFLIKRIQKKSGSHENSTLNCTPLKLSLQDVHERKVQVFLKIV